MWMEGIPRGFLQQLSTWADQIGLAEMVAGRSGTFADNLEVEMIKHWQDFLCPFCHNTDGSHKIDCSFLPKLERYEARKAAGECPVVPEGIDTMCTFDTLIETLEELT